VIGGSVAVEWYAARAGGLVAFALLTVSILLGLGLAGRTTVPGWPRFAVEDLHRFAGILAGCFVVLHVLLVVADGYVPFGLVDVLVPFATSYHPAASALGIVAAELLAALAVTNALRTRIGYRTWRRLHGLNLAVWLLALVHGLAIGTDRSTVGAAALYGAAAASVGGVGAWRLLWQRASAAA